MVIREQLICHPMKQIIEWKRRQIIDVLVKNPNLQSIFEFSSQKTKENLIAVPSLQAFPN